MSPHRPLPWVAAALTLGALLGLQVVPPVGPALAILPLAGLAVVRLRPSPALCLLGLSLVALGFLRARLGDPRPPRHPLAEAAALAQARDEVLVGRWRSRDAFGRGWLDPAGGEARLGHRLLFELQVAAPPDGTWVAILPGSEVVPWPRGPVLPGRMGVGRWLATSRVRADELLRLESSLDLLPAPPSRLERLRNELGRRAAFLERGPASRGLVRALITGDRRALPSGRTDLFTRTGTRHLLALSGLHVALLFACLLHPLTRLVRHQSLRFCLQALALLIYAVTVGASDPVTRATLALVLGQLAPFLRGGGAHPGLGRRADALSIWSFALLLELLVEPNGLLSLSLQLSYAATLGLILGTRPLTQMLVPGTWRRSPEVEIHTRRGSLWRALRRCTLEPLVRGFAASCVAVLATLPATWNAFGEWSPLGLVVTPLALPFVAALLCSSWFGIVLPWFASPTLTESLARGLLGLLHAADTWPGTPAFLPPRPGWLLLLLAAGSFAALSRARLRRPVLAGWALLLVPWTLAPAGLEVHALDVGHGSAIALRAPGLPALVFDAGSRDRRGLFDQALAPLLRAWDGSDLVLALSHPHADHDSALPRLIERFPPSTYLGSLSAQGVERLPHGTLRLGTGPGGIRLRPAPSTVPLELHWLRGSNLAGNEGSASLEVTWRGSRLLLCGDAEGEGLAGILLGRPRKVDSRLLLFPHHGSDTPHTAALLQPPPQEVWISAAGPPAVGPELDRRRLSWGWTARDGPLALFLP